MTDVMTVAWSLDPTYEPNVLSSGIMQPRYIPGVSALIGTHEKLPDVCYIISKNRGPGKER